MEAVKSMTNNNKEKVVLLIEDNEVIIKANKRLLERNGYNVLVALTLKEARKSLKSSNPDIIILDLMLPDGNGLEFIDELHSGNHKEIPILILTGLSTKEDIINGLKKGGDDYLTKPYDFSVFLARVEALLRRAQQIPAVINKGGFTLDVTANKAFHQGVDLLLTQKEFALFLIFIQNDERYLKNQYLYEKAWNQPMAEDKQALKKTIYRLREKIKDSGWKIEWFRGEGYIFTKE